MRSLSPAPSRYSSVAEDVAGAVFLSSFRSFAKADAGTSRHAAKVVATSDDASVVCVMMDTFSSVLISGSAARPAS